jgi:hypothetical protein
LDAKVTVKADAQLVTVTVRVVVRLHALDVERLVVALVLDFVRMAVVLFVFLLVQELQDLQYLKLLTA